MRTTCLECVTKHLGQAIILAHEVPDYPNHYMLAIGHLAEAEAESIQLYPEMQQSIREIRLSYMESRVLDVEALFTVFCAIESLK